MKCWLPLAATLLVLVGCCIGIGFAMSSNPSPRHGIGLTSPFPLHAVVFPQTKAPLLNGTFTCYAQRPKKGADYSNCRPYHAPTTTSTSTTSTSTTTTQAPTTTQPPATTTTVPTVAVPASINASCSTDVTAQLASFLDAQSNAIVQFPSDACYLVSNSASLTIAGTTGLTIDGNGSTLEQTSYVGGVDPVLSLGADTTLTVNDLTVKGHSSTGGPGSEGDYGVKMWMSHGVTLDGLTIENVEGDGLALYPSPEGQTKGVNWNVTVENSTLTGIGYHAITPESVDNFVFEHNTVTGGDIDAEVDFSCQSTWPNGCGTLADPLVGAVGMHFIDNSFPNGFSFEDGMSCMPIGDWSFTGNNFGNGYLWFQFPTANNMSLSTLTTCGYPSGLTISGNTSGVSNQKPTWVNVEGWQNVQIDSNVFTSPLEGAGASLCSVQSAQIENNTFTNAKADVSVDACHIGWPASSVTACNNTYGYNYPGPVVVKNDGACS